VAPQRDEIFKQKVNDCVQHIILQNFHAIRSWNFRIFAMRWWPRFFCATLYMLYTESQTPLNALLPRLSNDSRLRSSARGDFSVTRTKCVLRQHLSVAGRKACYSIPTHKSGALTVMTRSVAILRHYLFSLAILTCSSDSNFMFLVFRCHFIHYSCRRYWRERREYSDHPRL